MDTCVTGPNCTVVEHTNQIVSVSGFSHEYEAIHDVPIVTAATAFDDPVTGNITILIIGQALYLSDKVSCTLLSPNQLRSNGIVVDYVPVHLAPRSHPSKHASYSNDEENFQLLLQLRGCISYFKSRTLTQEELESCHWMTLTNEHHWDPHSDAFQHEETNKIQHAMATASRDRKTFPIKRVPYHILNDEMDQLSSIFSPTHPFEYNNASTSSST